MESLQNSHSLLQCPSFSDHQQMHGQCLPSHIHSHALRPTEALQRGQTGVLCTCKCSPVTTQAGRDHSRAA